MKWFKHYSDNHRGQGVQIMLDELGYFGPFLYYTIYEICAEKLEGKVGFEVLEDQCLFRFHSRVICSATRAKPSTVERGLVLGESCGFWTFKKDGKFFEISVPILLKLLDRDSKKPRAKRGKPAQNTRLDKDKELDKDVDVAEFEQQQPTQKNEIEKIELLNAVQNFEAQFDERTIRVKELLIPKFGNRLGRYAAQIINQWGSVENFERWVYDCESRFDQNPRPGFSVEGWIEVCIKRELGVISDAKSNKKNS